MPIETGVFRRIGVMVSTEEFERLVVQAIERMVPARTLTNPEGDLPPTEAAALRRAGLDLSPPSTDSGNVVVRSAVEYAALLAASLTVAQTAERLGVDGSRIRRRLADRTLYGVKLGSGWRLPAFQFSSSGLVSGIERVLPRLDPGLHPLAVLHWLTQPNVDLFLDESEVPVSPLDWLRLGRDPAIVAELAEHVGPGA